MKLSTKIILTLSLALVSILSISAWMTIQKESRVISMMLNKHGESLANIIGAACIETLLVADYPELETFLLTTGSERKDILFIKVLQKGKVISSYNSKNLDTMSPVIFVSDILLPINEDVKYTQKLGQIHLGLSDKKNQAFINSQIRDLIISIVFTFLILALLEILLMSWIVIKPLHKLIEGIRKITEGDLNYMVELKSKDELADLAFSFNQMTNSLRGLTDSLLKNKERLEHRVLEKTEELAKAKDAAEKSNRAKTIFLGKMSHELRTPMNAIIGFTQLTLLSNLDSEQREQLQLATKSAHFLLRLIDDLLDFAMVDMGRLKLNIKPFNLNNELLMAVKMLSISAKEKKLKLNYHSDPDIPDQIFGDPFRLKQIIVNLLSNAIKFTHQGKIELHVKRNLTGRLHSSKIKEKICIHFIVTDTGIGISQDQQKSIFKIFNQVEEGSTRNYEGVGLGLAISKELVNLMEGEMWVESTLSSGSSFHFNVFFSPLRKL